MRSPHHLEVYPTQADRFQLGSDMILEQGRADTATCSTVQAIERALEVLPEAQSEALYLFEF